MNRKMLKYKGVLYNKYEIDDAGNVYRRGNDVSLKPFGDGRGYLKVDVMDDDNTKVGIKIHLAVAHTFIGIQKDGMIINHKDGNKHNNNLGNLEYITQRANVEHAQTTIRNLPYLSHSTVMDIRKLREERCSIGYISSSLKIPQHVVVDVLRSKTYTHYK